MSHEFKEGRNPSKRVVIWGSLQIVDWILWVYLEGAMKCKVLFCYNKGWSTYICYNTDEPRKHCAKWKKPHTKATLLDSISVELSSVYSLASTSKYSCSEVVHHRRIEKKKKKRSCAEYSPWWVTLWEVSVTCNRNMWNAQVAVHQWNVQKGTYP